MRHGTLIGFAAAVAVAGSGAASLRAGAVTVGVTLTTATWPQARYDAAQTGFNRGERRLNAATVASLHQKFATQLNYGGSGQPIVAGNVVYASSGNSIEAFDTNLGQMLWQDGAFGQPVYDAGRIFQADQYGVTAVDALTGVELWRVPVPVPFARMGLSAADGALFLADGASVSRLSEKDGATAWTRGLPDQSFGAPAISGGAVDVSTVRYDNAPPVVAAIRESDGTPLWSTTMPAPGEATPAVVSGGQVITVSDSVLLSLDAATGSVTWSVTLGQCCLGNQPAVGDNAIIETSAWDGTIYALDPATGAVRWTTHQRQGALIQPATIAGGVVLVETYIPAQVLALDPSTGMALAAYKLSATNAFTGSAPVVSDGRVFVTAASFLCIQDPNCTTTLYEYAL